MGDRRQKKGKPKKCVSKLLTVLMDEMDPLCSYGNCGYHMTERGYRDRSCTRGY
jgi:hypothetical protein